MMNRLGCCVLVLIPAMATPSVMAQDDRDRPQPALKTLALTVTPAAVGRQLVRVSLPVPQGVLSQDQTFAAITGRQKVVAATRVLTWHPVENSEPRSARRALVTFPFTFKDKQPVHFTLLPTKAVLSATRSLPIDVQVRNEVVTINYTKGPVLTVRVLAPSLQSAAAPRIEIVESNQYYLWQRIHFSDPQWPREIEVRADALGGVAVVAHLRRDLPGDGYAPDFGWEIDLNTASATLPFIAMGHSPGPVMGGAYRVDEHMPNELLFADDRYRLYHPMAPFTHRGRIEMRRNAESLSYHYWRGLPAAKVPMQQASWRRAEFVVSPSSLAPLTATLESPHKTQVDWQMWAALYNTGKPLDLKGQPELADLLRYHHDATVRCMAHGDDWGNVTTYSDDKDTGDVFGMNRLNHCIPIFEEGYRSGDRRLLETAVLWCNNFYDQSIWWGPEQTGGTRYNNQRALGQTPPDNDNSYMWRSNSAVSFCTKGFASFFYAYEQTGDPRMKEALDAQVQYASQFLTAGLDYTRNVGIVHDFIVLYRFTGEKRYLDQALRLFRELRVVLSTGDLFTEGGRPIVADPPFIDDDTVGPQYPYAKPYIIGYALEGLPELAEYAPHEPKLRDVVRAVADFLAESQDPIGGWRYPHPRSSYVSLSQAMEHAWHFVQTDRLVGPQQPHLDTIERILRQRLLGWRKTRKIFYGIAGWEITSGAIKEPKEIYNLYKHPRDRDFTLDYEKGKPSFGSSAPEGIVYFPEVLAFYLKHRDVSRLLEPPGADEPLGKVLARVDESKSTHIKE